MELRADHCSQKYRWMFFSSVKTLPDAFWFIKTYFFFFSLFHLPSKPDIHFKLSTWRNLSYISYYIFTVTPEKKQEKWVNIIQDKQGGSLQEKEAAEGMIVSVTSLLQTMGSAECVLYFKNWERKRSNCGNRKGIFKRARNSYELKKKCYAKKKNPIKVRFWDTFSQYHA